MKVLLDTHFVVWSILDPKKLVAEERKFLLESRNEIFVSTVSLWEISLKYSIKKFNFDKYPIEQIVETIEESGFEIISLDKSDAITFYKLPRLPNKDPFDRMLVWQSIRSDFHFMSIDPEISEYEKNGLKLLKLRSS